MPVLLFIANLFGISILRLVIYAICIVAVIVAGITIRQHYINVGWYEHAAKIKKQDDRAAAAADEVQKAADACAADSWWDVVSASCKTEESK